MNGRLNEYEERGEEGINEQIRMARDGHVPLCFDIMQTPFIRIYANRCPSRMYITLPIGIGRDFPLATY